MISLLNINNRKKANKKFLIVLQVKFLRSRKTGLRELTTVVKHLCTCEHSNDWVACFQGVRTKA